MKNILLIVSIIFLFVSCDKKDTPKEVNNDCRESYTGVFSFSTIKSTVVMCYDTLPPCYNRWKEINVDTSYYSSNVEILDTNRLIINFGDSIIGIVGSGHTADTIKMELHPILLNDSLYIPEYSSLGGHNKFIGFYSGYDTIKLYIHFGMGMGGYDKYSILGVRTN
jgi:hypothetical protein